MLAALGPGRFHERISKTVGSLVRNTTAFKHLSAKVESAKETKENNNNNNNNNQNASTAAADSQIIQQDGPVPDIGFGSKVNKGKGDSTRPLYIPEEADDADPVNLEPPTTCCMSGCPNCVWLEYAEALTKCMVKPDVTKDRIKKELDSIQDPNIKAFIMMELRTRGLL